MLWSCTHESSSWPICYWSVSVYCSVIKCYIGFVKIAIQSQILQYAKKCRDVLWCAALCCAVQWTCAAMCCAVLCCAVLCCAVLCCDVLCCAVLCCRHGTLLHITVLWHDSCIDIMQIWWLLISINWISIINQRHEPPHEKEHVKISDTAKFQSCRPNTREMEDICKTRK